MSSVNSGRVRLIVLLASVVAAFAVGCAPQYFKDEIWRGGFQESDNGIVSLVRSQPVLPDQVIINGCKESLDAFSEAKAYIDDAVVRRAKLTEEQTLFFKEYFRRLAITVTSEACSAVFPSQLEKDTSSSRIYNEIRYFMDYGSFMQKPPGFPWPNG